jgi:peptide/nickel transport system substrate-binding protein
LQPSERSQFRNRVYSGEVSIGMWQLDYVYYPFQPTFTVPTGQHCYWAPAYGNWYATDGQAGEEPTGDIRQLQVIWDELQMVTDQETQIEMFRQLFDLHMEHCWIIGIVGHPPRPVVIGNNLQNVPETGVYAWTIGQYFAAIRLEQLYFEG